MFFYGIHGVAVMGVVFQPIWFSLLDQNIDAKAAGEQLPNIVVEPFSNGLFGLEQVQR